MNIVACFNMGVSSNNRFNQDSAKNTPPVKPTSESITLVGLTYTAVDAPTAASAACPATVLVPPFALCPALPHKAADLPRFAAAAISDA